MESAELFQRLVMQTENQLEDLRIIMREFNKIDECFDAYDSITSALSCLKDAHKELAHLIVETNIE